MPTIEMLDGNLDRIFVDSAALNVSDITFQDTYGSFTTFI